MIIKPTSDLKARIATLQTLLARPDASDKTKKIIEQDIRNLQAGAKGESEAAYEMEFYYGVSTDWMIIHDLRIVCEGRVAQIDHLVINRWLDIWVCESKHFAEGISIDDKGECATFYNGKPQGTASPLEQNRKHIIVLESLFKTDIIKLPTRLGFKIKPTLYSLILVSKGARIGRPKTKIEGIENIIKNDQFKAHIDKTLIEDNNFFSRAKKIGRDALADFAHKLARLHQPIEFKIYEKYGLPKVPPRSQQNVSNTQVKQQDPIAKPEAITAALDLAEATHMTKQKIRCETCGETVTDKVVQFCLTKVSKYDGKIHCIKCQQKY